MLQQKGAAAVPGIGQNKTAAGMQAAKAGALGGGVNHDPAEIRIIRSGAR
jgi:hypothetical protein